MSAAESDRDVLLQRILSVPSAYVGDGLVSVHNHDFLEDPGTPLASEYLVRHRSLRGGNLGEPDPRHLKGSTVAASFPT